MATTNKGFIKDWQGNYILPITRGELVLDKLGNPAFTSPLFEAGYKHEDGSINTYGLISAAERALISGGSEGQGIGDIYNRLQHINSGFKVNGNALPFYDTSIISTPINISGASNQIVIGVNGHEVSIGLHTLHTSGLSGSNIIKSITVDKYGRVTALTSGKLLNSEIPPELDGKKISNSTLTGCSTENEEIGTSSKAIANKYYVDKKFEEVTGIATGALRFAGTIGSVNEATSKLNDIANNNCYYKVTADFTLGNDYLHSSTATTNYYGKIKAGDTLIIYTKDNSRKFVHIPSGDDITTITVKQGGAASNAVDAKIGNITLQFDAPFSVVAQGDRTAQVTLPKASNSQDGYLSNSDYIKFSSYADELAVSYNQTVASTAVGAYKIGTITIAGADTDIYGLNNISALSLTNDTTNSYNPILKFTENGSAVEVTYKGINGIKARKATTGTAIEFLAANEVLTDSTDYIKIDSGYKFGVKLGSIDPETKKVTEGLVNFSTIHNLAIQVGKTAVFETIDYTLVGTDNTKYKYGNDKLKTAVTVTI